MRVLTQTKYLLPRTLTISALAMSFSPTCTGTLYLTFATPVTAIGDVDALHSFVYVDDFARALIAHPKLLLLDEPTEGIQPSVIQEIGAAIRTINKETGLSILLVEQYLDFALELADECYVMDKGQIVLHIAAGEAKKEEIQQHMLAS